MKLRLICVGRLSEPYLKAGVDDFSARIRRYLPLETVELKEEKGGTKPDPRYLREREGERLLTKIPLQSHLVALDEGGKQLTSEGLSAFFERHMLNGTAEVAWVIGGPYGLAGAVKERAGTILSLSSMTFTHQMARLILLEQVYRALTILRGEPYHNR